MSDERPEINAVLEHYGARTQHKRSYATNCVFHEDRSPSMSVETERQLFNCKSCGAAGDSYQLIMLKEETDFAGAREIVTALGLATGSAGGSDTHVRGSSYSSRRETSGRPRDRQGHGTYVPRWRRS